MNMPGFTAEASFYKGTIYYSTQYFNTVGKNESSSSKNIVAQQIRHWFETPWGGGGGGGSGSDFPVIDNTDFCQLDYVLRSARCRGIRGIPGNLRSFQIAALLRQRCYEDCADILSTCLNPF